ncbi:MAG: choice-of-anchor G family protein, partial [Renibacterium sp.]|nr:choice-of-anchor G family protein [Renibacterium sp.]
MSGAVAASLLALPLAGSAQAIQSPSGDPVEARGSIVGAFLGGMALAEAGLTSASSVKSPGPDKQPLNLNVFGGKALQLPNINLPIVKNGPGQPGLLDIGGAVGALNSYAAAQAAAGKAAAGAITDSGSIDPSAAQDPSKNINAKIDLRVLLDQLGLDTAHQLISTAEVDANALSSSINATKKPITAADTSYAFADAHARLQLPPVAALTGLLTSGLDQLKTPINAVIGDTGALNTALKAALAALNVDLVVASLKTTGSTVSITGTDAVVAALAASLPTKIVSKNGGVTLDLTTGLADVDVAKIYNATGGAKDLNGLPPNTDVLDDKMVEALVNGVADVADAVIEKLNTGLKDALLNNLKLTIDLAAKVDLVGGVASANTSINITGTLAQFTGVTGAGDPTITATDLSIKPPLLPPVNIPAGTIVNALKPVLLTALKTVLGTAIDGLNTTLTANPGPIQAIVEPIVKAAGDALSPAFQAIKKVARLIINDQPTLDGRPADIASPTAYSVRALTLVLFPGGLPGFPTPPAPGGGQVPDPRDGLARVSISSSTADFGAAAAAPALAVNPASVPAGGKTSVTGTGWATGTPVSVQLKDPSGANVGAPVSVTPNADGSLPATDLPVPAGSAAGAYTVVGTQGTTPPVSTPLTVTAAATPTIKADPTSVPAGGKTSVTGTGWDPASPVSVQLKDAAGANVGSPVSITPGADGSLPATDLPVPAGTKAGDYTVVGTQGSNTQTAPLTVTDAAAPTIKADPASVPAGTKTSVTGTGWTPGTPVSVQLTDPAGAAVGTPVSITPAADGSLPATDLPVPATATPGAYTVVGTQGTAKQSAPLTVTAAVVPTIKANPTSVPAGGKTSVTGTGWDPASPVSVQLKDAAGANVGSPVS